MNAHVDTIHNFIGGQFVAPHAGAFLDSYRPATGRAYLRVPDSDARDVDQAVIAAEKAFETWSRTSPDERAEMLERIADVLASKLDAFAEAESCDQGKPVSLAKTVDIPRSIYNFRFFAKECHNFGKGETRTVYVNTTRGTGTTTGALSYTQYVPAGVAGLISPWNLPLYLLTWKIAPCLAAGCTCVCKPSELTSLTAYMLCSVLKEAGLPDGVVNMVFGTGARAGHALVTHPRVPLISFTGGTATGEKITRDSAPFCKKLSLELGGKNAGIVFADCDFEKAVSTSLRSAFSNQGEICLCTSRIFVERSIYQRFVDALAEGARKIKMGDPKLPDTQHGALVSEEHMNKVLSYIQLARDEGGRIVCGGERQRVLIQGENSEDGWFVPPTIITDVSPKGRVMQEEIFGPVVTITPFDDEAEVIRMANDVRYGLAATVWTENGKRQRRVAEALHAGTVWVNCWMVRDLHMPFGGWKHSGTGSEGGRYSMEFYTNVKTICLSD